MSIFLSILIIIVCILLILIILIQNPKGGGIASNFISTNQFIGARQQVELIEQITWGFITGLVVLCIIFSAVVGTGTQNQKPMESKVSKWDIPVPETPSQVQPPTIPPSSEPQPK
jgi:preprotein translocase subunit SecG